MIVDTSALIAIVTEEPDAPAYASALAEAAGAHLSSGNYLEAGIVADRSANSADGHRLDRLLREANVTIEPVTLEQARIAREAYHDFGKGSGHPAGLNFGDCFAYALAKDRGEPLLFKGDDFSHTDVRSALP